MSLRKRCLVLRQIEHLKGLATVELIHKALPDLERVSIQQALYNLCAQDRILKRTTKAIGETGRPQFCYKVNPDWESSKTDLRKGPIPKTGRKNFKEAMQTNTRRALGSVPFRDRKIKLLLKLMPHALDTDRDLLIGLLADLGYKYSNG